MSETLNKSGKFPALWKPVEVTGGDLAFGGDMDKLLPSMDEIPEAFKQHSGTKWNKIVNDWFYAGIKIVNAVPKQGIDHNKALYHIKAILCSWEPSSEEKESGVAYLLSLWYDVFEYEVAKK